MPALGTFIAGPYTGTYNGQTIGIVEAGYELEIVPSSEEITGDAYGDTVIDGIHRGGQAFINFIGQEQLKGVLMAAWPYSATAAISYAFADLGVLGTIGKLWTSIATNIVLTAVAGTTAASNPATFTALAIPTADTRRIAMKAGLRKFPVRMRLLPQDVSGTIRVFTVT